MQNLTELSKNNLIKHFRVLITVNNVILIPEAKQPKQSLLVRVAINSFKNRNPNN